MNRMRGPKIKNTEKVQKPGQGKPIMMKKHVELANGGQLTRAIDNINTSMVSYPTELRTPQKATKEAKNKQKNNNQATTKEK